MPETHISVCESASELVKQLLHDAAVLRIECNLHDNGCTVVDAGVECQGGIEAGLRIAEICMAGLGKVGIVPAADFPRWPWAVKVSTSQPVLACLGSQYAGWSLSVADGDSKYRAMGSGPARALAGKEALFSDLAYRDQCDRAVLVLESDQLPPAELAVKVAAECAIDLAGLTLIVTPTGSLAGCTQIAARVVEVALHKAHELKYPLAQILDAQGMTPLPPPAPDFLTAMGRTNDTILFGGRVHLFVSGSEADAKALANALPSGNSSDYGKPFAEVFTEYKYDFFKIDPMLFSPAMVSITAIESGSTFHAGRLDAQLIDRSFGGPDS